MKLFSIRLSFVLLYAATLIVDAVPAETIKLNCLIQHLKTLEMLESDYPKFAGSTVDDCDELLAEETEQTLKRAVDKLTSTNIEVATPSYYRIVVDTLREFTSQSSEELETCLRMRLAAERWAEINLLHVVYSTQTSEEKGKELENLKRKIDEIGEKALAYCVVADATSVWLDELFEAMKTTIDNPIPVYCTRKYVVEKNLINTSYTVALNPLNVDVSEVNCEEMVDVFQKQMISTVALNLSMFFKNESSFNCAKEKMLKLGIVDKMFAVAVVAAIELTNEQKANEMKIFIGSATELMITVNECSQLHASK